ncbi:hypothetical protein DPMN_062972 [Dreissena polymorpha]|uniref:Uncharacterized protein n=1 Tax=Dreissena polymorpha TaxID=45954 RepID=A0A9D4HJQ7_DREPO|nr:hypothetical protein DPMN_062972 [Dreissena polymorpha]
MNDICVVFQHHGEFGLLAYPGRSVTVGAICCAVVIPLGRMLEFLFRRSKVKCGLMAM